MEELGAGNGLGANPHLLFPVAHGIGVGSAPLVAGAHKVVGKIGMLLQEGNLLFRVVIGPCVGNFFNIHQIQRQVGFHLLIVAVIVGEFAVLVHQVVGDHEEFQLFVLGVEHQIIPLALPGQGGAGGIDEGEHPHAPSLHSVNELHHFLGVAGDGGVDDHRAVSQPLVAGCQVLRSILHIYRQRRLAPHIDLNLHRGSVGAADTDEIDVVKAFLPDLIHDLLNLGTQSQRTVDTVDIALLVEVSQAGTLGLGPSFRFVIHTIFDPFLSKDATC